MIRLSRALDTTFCLAAAGAALLWAALPPLDLWPLGWLAPVPWVLLIRRKELPGRRRYLALWLVGFLFWMAAMQWLRLPHWATSFGWVAISLYQAFYLPVFVGLCRVAVHRLRISAIIVAPVVWTGLELVRAHLLTGITMANLGHTQYRWIGLIQMADLAGAYGVSFVVMFAAACLARILPCEERRWTPWPVLPLAGVLGVVLLYGHLRTSVPQAEPTVRIALIQESIDIEFKLDPEKFDEIHRRYRALSEEAVREHSRPRKPDLIVWPETMFRHPLIEFEPDAQPPEWWEHSAEDLRRVLPFWAAESRMRLAEIPRELGTAMLLGVDTIRYTAAGPRHSNSAVLVDPARHQGDELAGRYDKMHLVLFGEYVPFAEYWPWLQRLTPLPFSSAAGTRPAALDVTSPLGTLRVSPSICYENVLPHVIRRQINALAKAGREPDVLVNLTNDGWFWGSSELDMHLVCAVFRAVEFHKPFLVAANTGFSAWIDGDGRIRAQGPRRQKGIVLAEVAPDPRSSWYLQYGDWPAGCCLAGCGILALVGWFTRGRRFAGKSQSFGV